MCAGISDNDDLHIHRIAEGGQAIHLTSSCK